MSNFKLNFIGIGAEKAGTTWVADCLREHPEVYIPEAKEAFFFNDFDPHFLAIKNYRYERGLKWYARQFSDGAGKVVGEISPTYLYSKVAAKRIKRHFPDVKLIVVLRDPAKRALSQYIHDKRLGVIKDISFSEAIRMYSNYIEKGLYYKHLEDYSALFKEGQMLILFSDDLERYAEKTLREIYKFLGLKNIDFIPSSLNKRSNTAGKARFPVINYFMMQVDYFLRTNRLDFVLKLLDSLGIRELAKKVRDINSAKLEKYPKIDEEAAAFLNDAFADDIKDLEKKFGKKLVGWRR